MMIISMHLGTMVLATVLVVVPAASTAAIIAVTVVAAAVTLEGTLTAASTAAIIAVTVVPTTTSTAAFKVPGPVFALRALAFRAVYRRGRAFRPAFACGFLVR
jgi:hypothetical protein